MLFVPTNTFVCLIFIAFVLAGCTTKTYEEAGTSYIEFRLSDDEVRALDADAKIVYLGIAKGSISYGKTLSTGLVEAAKRSSCHTSEHGDYIRWEISLEPRKTAKEKSRIAYVECYVRTNSVRACGTATYIK